MLSLLVKTRLMVLRTILSLFLRILGKFVRIDDQLILFVSYVMLFIYICTEQKEANHKYRQRLHGSEGRNTIS